MRRSRVARDAVVPGARRDCSRLETSFLNLKLPFNMPLVVAV